MQCGQVEEFTMREKIIAAARVFLTAYASAAGWVLAGVGWGVVTGATLEAIFGRGTEGLLDSTDGAALAGSVGAVFGMLGSGLLMTFLHGITLIPLFALIGKVSGRYAPGQEHLGLMGERSVRSGALVVVILATLMSLTLGAMCGTGITLESIYGEGGPTLALHWATAFGTLIGGIVGVIEMGWTVARALPPEWQQQVGLAMRPPQAGCAASPSNCR
jgi:hypothetical protein